MRCEHENDDGAYVLGALSPAERTAYERHLATCSFCREAIADISGLPDLLSRCDPLAVRRSRPSVAEEFARLLDPGPAKDARYGEPVAPAVPRPIRLLRIAAAAVLVVMLGAGALAWTRNGTSGSVVTMSSVDGSSAITGTVRLTSTSGGTRVTVVGAYRETVPPPYIFRLIAYGPAGEREQIGSWQAVPGARFAMEGVTHFARGGLTRLELVRHDGRAVLAYDVR